MGFFKQNIAPKATFPLFNQLMIVIASIHSYDFYWFSFKARRDKGHFHFLSIRLIFCAATKTFDIFRISQKTVIVCNFVLVTLKLVSRNWSKKIHKIWFTLNSSINTVWVVKLSTSSRDFLSVYLVDCLKATLLASKSQSSVVFIT